MFIAGSPEVRGGVSGGAGCGVLGTGGGGRARQPSSRLVQAYMFKVSVACRQSSKSRVFATRAHRSATMPCHRTGETANSSTTYT